MDKTAAQTIRRGVLLIVSVLLVLFMIGDIASASHRAWRQAGTPYLTGNSDDVVANCFGDTPSAESGDKLKCKLWRVIPAWPDTFLGSSTDWFPGSNGGGGTHFHATEYECAYPDIARNYKTEAEFDTKGYNPSDLDSSPKTLTCDDGS